MKITDMLMNLIISAENKNKNKKGTNKQILIQF